MAINISGAVDIRIIDYDNRKFFLFSDIHTGFDGLCPEPCVNYLESRCYTVDGFIRKS